MSPHEFRLMMFAVALFMASVLLSSCEKPRSPYPTSAKIDGSGCTAEINQEHIMDPRGAASAYCNWLAGIDVESEIGYLTNDCTPTLGVGFHHATVFCPRRQKTTVRDCYVDCVEKVMP